MLQWLTALSAPILDCCLWRLPDSIPLAAETELDQHRCPSLHMALSALAQSVSGAQLCRRACQGIPRNRLKSLTSTQTPEMRIRTPPVNSHSRRLRSSDPRMDSKALVRKARVIQGTIMSTILPPISARKPSTSLTHRSCKSFSIVHSRDLPFTYQSCIRAGHQPPQMNVRGAWLSLAGGKLGTRL